MRSDLGKVLLTTLLLAGGSALAAEGPIVEAYVKFISATKPLAGIGIVQDKKVNGLVIPTDMLTDAFYYRGPARMELIALATTEIPAEPAPNAGEKAEVVKRPARGIKSATPTHALAPAGKPPVAWIDLPSKQGQLHLILMVNPGKDNGITAIPDVPGSFPPGSNRYFNLCPFPLTIKLPSGDQQIAPGGSKVARPGSKDNDYYDLQIASRVNEADMPAYSGRVFHMESTRKLYMISPGPGDLGRIALKVIEDRPPPARSLAQKPPAPKGEK
ncbi:MAG: hypothetical protein ACR2KA_05650 [Opitutales bacterium]|jgi:hypothetical protein